MCGPEFHLNRVVSCQGIFAVALDQFTDAICIPSITNFQELLFLGAFPVPVSALWDSGCYRLRSCTQEMSQSPGLFLCKRTCGGDSPVFSPCWQQTSFFFLMAHCPGTNGFWPAGEL